MTRRAVVIGGGIAGLSAARELAAQGLEVVLLEASGRLGGAIRTEKIEGVPVEAGADSFLAAPPALELCAALGLSRELVAPAVFGAHLWIGGRLRRLPPGSALGLPSSSIAAVRDGRLSLGGGARAALELLWARRLSGPDVPLGAFVTRRFGREVLASLVDPLLAGTRSGRPEDLSLAAAAPSLDRIARTNRSVSRALRRGRPPPVFRSLRGGLEGLVAALGDGLPAVRLNAPVEQVYLEGRGLGVRLSSGEEVTGDGVVVAVAAPVASSLLRCDWPAAAGPLGAIPYTPAVVATLVYPPGAISPPSGASGVLVPASEGRTLTACTWYSVKWPQAAPADGAQIVRCFAGRAGKERVFGLADGELTGALHDELSAMIGAGAEPRTVTVVRFEHGFPQYTLGHDERVRRAEAALRGHPVRLAGASYRGLGIPDCIAGGRAAARSLAEAFSD